MAAARGECRGCGQDVAVTVNGRVWAHGTPRCAGWGRPPRSRRWARVWPDELGGRRVTTLPDIGVWEPSRAA